LSRYYYTIHTPNSRVSLCLLNVNNSFLSSFPSSKPDLTPIIIIIIIPRPQLLPRLYPPPQPPRGRITPLPLDPPMRPKPLLTCITPPTQNLLIIIQLLQRPSLAARPAERVWFEDEDTGFWGGVGGFAAWAAPAEGVEEGEVMGGSWWGAGRAGVREDRGTVVAVVAACVAAEEGAGRKGCSGSGGGSAISWGWVGRWEMWMRGCTKLYYTVPVH
ncbi:hypothetical protein EX30DRAFT_380104, partial [Ascodesmis nigricans]